MIINHILEAVPRFLLRILQHIQNIFLSKLKISSSLKMVFYDELVHSLCIYKSKYNLAPNREKAPHLYGEKVDS